MATLWNKGVDDLEAVKRFTTGDDVAMDRYLAKYDVQGSMAHVKMLQSIHLLNEEEMTQLLGGLERIARSIEEGSFVIEEGVEDVHSQVEILLTRELGSVGEKIHSGRSRNDQVLVDLKLFLRDVCVNLAEEVFELFEILQIQSEKYKEVLMPGYTHDQIAMPSSFGLWLGGYAEALVDDVYLLAAARKICNRNPLGSAAGYGNSFPLDREMTTRLLSFDSLNYNSIAAQLSRGKCEKAVADAMAGVASTVSRLSCDMITYSCQNFGFITFPENLTTGSSIMPHKKNPDVCELIRARMNRIQSLPNEITLVCANLTQGYHRDYQLLKEMLFPAFGSMTESLRMMRMMVEAMTVNEKIMESSLYDPIYTVEEVNRLVMKGVPFRSAYRQVGLQVRTGLFSAGDKRVNHTHTGSIGNPANDEIRRLMVSALSALGIEKN